MKNIADIQWFIDVLYESSRLPECHLFALCPFLFCRAWGIFENFFFQAGQAAGFGLWVAFSDQPMCVPAVLDCLILSEIEISN
ncbi:MAG: hypothetical protein ACE5FF_12925 [Saprospiraceae bacterium]